MAVLAAVVPMMMAPSVVLVAVPRNYAKKKQQKAPSVVVAVLAEAADQVAAADRVDRIATSTTAPSAAVDHGVEQTMTTTKTAPSAALQRTLAVDLVVAPVEAEAEVASWTAQVLKTPNSPPPPPPPPSHSPSSAASAHSTPLHLAAWPTVSPTHARHPTTALRLLHSTAPSRRHSGPTSSPIDLRIGYRVRIRGPQSQARQRLRLRRPLRGVARAEPSLMTSRLSRSEATGV